MEDFVCKIKGFAKNHHKSDSSGHSFLHIKRVYDMAMLIASDYPQADLLILQLAALLHDVDDYKLRDGKDALVPSYLKSLGLNTDLIDKVLNTIDCASYSENLEHKAEDIPLEAKILADADRLDVVGAVGIIRTVLYGVKVGEPLFLPEYFPNYHLTKEEYRDASRKEAHGIAHLFEKALELSFYTDKGREEGERRKCFLRTFLRQFFTETGNIDWIAFMDKQYPEE